MRYYLWYRQQDSKSSSSAAGWRGNWPEEGRRYRVSEKSESVGV